VTYLPTTYVALSSGGISTQFSANTIGQINTVGFDFIRFRSYTITSGTANFVAMSSRLVASIMLDNPLPVGSNTIGNVGINGTVPVSGTFWQATQPVSGTFYQATQPVSGTFWQGTQPISNAPLTNLEINIGAPLDTVATTDTGTFSLIALTKRIAQNITNMSAKLPAALGVQGSGASLSVVQASSSSFSVVDVVRVPTYAESLVITQATAITITAPLTARTMKVQADNTNTVTLRYKVAATPTASSGHQLEPGRSEDWTVAGDIVVIAESTASAQKIYVTWGA
jgi:hypothetical protein